MQCTLGFTDEIDGTHIAMAFNTLRILAVNIRECSEDQSKIIIILHVRMW